MSSALRGARFWLNAALLSAVSAVAAAVACSGGSDLPSGIDPGGTGGALGSGGTGGMDAGPCTDSETRTCSVTLGLHGNILDCFDGIQTCSAGVWGACTDGTTSQRHFPNQGHNTHKY